MGGAATPRDEIPIRRYRLAVDLRLTNAPDSASRVMIDEREVDAMSWVLDNETRVLLADLQTTGGTLSFL
ncbi:MAG: hypothetical protein WAM97_11525 [Acidimicrobiales bacterium]